MHLLLNTLTVGFVMAIGLFVAALIARNDLLEQVSLVAFVGIALVGYFHLRHRQCRRPEAVVGDG